MKFIKIFLFFLAILFGQTTRVNSDMDILCQSELTECKCDYYTGAVTMDCSEMLLEKIPNFSEDKVECNTHSIFQLKFDNFFFVFNFF